MKHNWLNFFVANEPEAYRCPECKHIVICEADWCDSDGIVKWRNKILKEKCPGRAKKKVHSC